VPKCSECEKPAKLGWPAGEGKYLPLCVEHFAMLQQAENGRVDAANEQMRLLMEGARQAERDIHMVTGMPMPDHLRPRPVVHTGDRVDISGTVGVYAGRNARVQTGNIQINSPEWTAFSAAVQEDQTLSVEQRRQVSELASFIATEVAKPKTARSPLAVLGATLATIADICGVSQGLAAAWAPVSALVSQHLGLP
jgi:hypothetical protein